jgi:tetratricopeptide (TPR) repeat protein
LALLSVAAHKLPPPAPDATALYQSGDYAGAIKEGLHENSGASLATASRAALALAAERSPCLDCLSLAENLARKSIAADPKIADAHVFLAVTLGYKARIEGMIKARFSGYADEAKRNLDEALQIDPRNGWALAALGGWNIEIARKGGAYLARWLYGAGVDAGVKDFQAAFAAAPDNPVLRYQYALSLSGLDAGAWKVQIADALNRAGTMEPRTAYEKVVQARAKELLAAFNRKGRQGFDALVKHDQGYP